jgi:hypothetical protein
MASARLRRSAAYRIAVPWRATESSWSFVDMPYCIEDKFDYTRPTVRE